MANAVLRCAATPVQVAMVRRVIDSRQSGRFHIDPDPDPDRERKTGESAVSTLDKAGESVEEPIVVRTNYLFIPLRTKAGLAVRASDVAGPKFGVVEAGKESPVDVNEEETVTTAAVESHDRIR